MSGGEWNTTRERKQLAADAREQEREALRLEKRMLRDLGRFALIDQLAGWECAGHCSSRWVCRCCIASQYWQQLQLIRPLCCVT